LWSRIGRRRLVVLVGILLTIAIVAGAAFLRPWSRLAEQPTGQAAPSASTIPTEAATATPEGAGAIGPTAAPSSASDWQPAFPIRAAFYYPWFPEAWKQQGMNPFTRYHPALGHYDGGSPAVLAAHIRAMRYGGLQAAIASWWGQGSDTDRRLPRLLGAAAGQPFRWSVYHEAEGQRDPSVSQLTADLTHLRDRYGHDPGFLRIGGRFVVFAYAQDGDGCAMVDRWKQANTVGAYVVLKVFRGYRNCQSQPDGWHQYGPAVAASDHAPYSYSASPGFWKANEPSPRLTRDLAAWRTALRAMVASRARFQLVTTFNEWGEGTSVEAAKEWASASGHGAYLDALHETLGGAA
jgi:hypothetical protein